MSLPTVFSLVYLAAFFTYFCFGAYVLFLNSRALTNRLFAAACLTLCVWTFTYSIVISAPDYHTALFWRRLSALGWGTFHSVLVHLCLSMTGRYRLLSKPWVYFLLYVPAIINVYVFGASEEWSSVQHVLVKTGTGWTNVFANNLWDLYFNVYFVGFDVAAMWLLWRWRCETEDKREKTQSRILLFSFLLAFVLGAAFDVFLNAYTPLKVPQLASVFIIIPIATFLYCIKRYGLMLPSETRIAETGHILSEIQRRQVYFFIGVASGAGGVFNLLLYFVWGVDLQVMLWISLVMFACCLLVLSLPFLPLPSGVQDTVMAAVVAGFVFSMTYYTKNINAANIVWSFPLLLMLTACVFSARRILITIVAAAVVTELWLWLELPRKELTVGPFEHMSRIIVYLFGAFFAFLVNRIYMQRLQENEEQVGLQQVISSMSADFATVSAENFDTKVDKALETIGKLYRADLAHLVIFSEYNKSAVRAYEWRADSTDPSSTPFDQRDSYHSWLTEQLKEKKRLFMPDIERVPELPPESKKLLLACGTKSMLAVYLESSHRPIGYLEIQALSQDAQWRADHLETLQIIANILAHAFARIKSEQEVYRLAYYDYLTGLPNRFLMWDLLEQAVSTAAAKGTSVGIILIDLHSFKEINDTIGHEAGDMLLKKIAQSITDCVRPGDVVCRFGGDEFVVVMTGVTAYNVLSDTAERIIEAVRKPVMIHNQEFFVNSNAGISVYPLDGKNPEDLVKNADLAMNASKERGTNRYAFYSREMRGEIQQKTILINGLYRALEKQELLLYYQPQVDILTGRITGVEALIRWNHPGLGMVQPSVFIPLAEQSGLIHSIGEWVLRTACEQNKRWQDIGLPPIRVAVNLSPEQFKNPKLVAIVKNVLEDTRLPPQYLELEITESVAVKEAETVIRSLRQLKELGVSIAIDDFGSEYSSLGRLRSMPVDRIKMAMCLIQDLPTTPKDEAIAKAILYLARNIGVRVVAEGVETEQQLEFLTRWSCREVQGFYFYRSMPAEKVEEILRQGQ